MGVSHLFKHAARANASQQNTGAKDSTNIRSGSSNPKGGRALTNQPNVAGVNSFSRSAVKPGDAPVRPMPGGRIGAKSGKANVGIRTGNAKPTPGGRLGGK